MFTPIIAIYYTLVVMIIGFTLSHMFNRIYPQHNAGWIMLFPSIHITNVLLFILEAKGAESYFLEKTFDTENIASLTDEYHAILIIFCMISVPLILLPTIPLVYRGLNFNKTTQKKLRLNSIITTGIVILVMIIKLIISLVYKDFSTIIDDIIITALSLYAQYKYIMQIPSLYTIHNKQENTHATSNIFQCTKITETGTTKPQQELNPCPICGEDIEVGLHICPYCHERID